MLDYMRELQHRQFPLPDRSREEQEIQSIHQELKGRLEMAERARLQCLMDKSKALQKLVADDNFAAGFQLSWAVQKELQEVMDDGKAQSQRRGEHPQAVRWPLGRPLHGGL